MQLEISTLSLWIAIAYFISYSVVYSNLWNWNLFSGEKGDSIEKREESISMSAAPGPRDYDHLFKLLIIGDSG